MTVADTARAAPPAASASASGENGAVARPGRNELGAISLSERVVGKIVAQAVSEVPDAGAAAPRILGVTLPSAIPGVRDTRIGAAPKADVDVDLSVASVNVTISIRWPASVPAVTAAVRTRISERLIELTGLSVTDVRIHVSDLTTRAAVVPRVH